MKINWSYQVPCIMPAGYIVNSSMIGMLWKNWYIVGVIACAQGCKDKYVQNENQKPDLEWQDLT